MIIQPDAALSSGLRNVGGKAWNLARLGECLLPLFEADSEEAKERVIASLQNYATRFRRRWLELMGRKIGLQSKNEEEYKIVTDWLELMATNKLDFTLAHWNLARDLAEIDNPLQSIFSESEAFQSWKIRWLDSLGAAKHQKESRNIVALEMRDNNPLVIPRNHLVEKALESASFEGDYKNFYALLHALKTPYATDWSEPLFAETAPTGFTDSFRTFCGT